MKILVTGGSGHLGRYVVAELLRLGHTVRILSSSPSARRPGESAGLQWASGNLATGIGVAEALRDMEVLFHLASDPRDPQRVDVEGTRFLLERARAFRIEHQVFVSITGIDQPGMRDYHYYRLKLEAEGIVRASGVPFSILRATQFHYLLNLLLGQLARIPLFLPLPGGFLFQPVDEAELAKRLARCVVDGPLGSLRDYAGPEILPIKEIATSWALMHGISKLQLPIPLPGKVARAFRAGRNTHDGAERGKVGWLDWLRREAEKSGGKVASGR